MAKKRMQFKNENATHALWRNVPMAPRKLRQVADHVRHLSVEQALHQLSCSPLKGARIMKQVLEAAIANAENNNNADIDLLYVTTICVDGARTMKRIMPRARGRADRILKRSRHVRLQVAERQEVRRHGA